MTKRSTIALILGLSVTIVSLWYSLRNVDMGTTVSILQNSKIWLLIPLLLAFSLYYWIKAVRWQLLLRPVKRVSSTEVFSPMMLGFFGNNILPAHLGEFIRMYLAAKKLKLSNAEVLATIVLERILDVLSIVIILTTIILFGVAIPEDLNRAAQLSMSIGILLLVSVIAAVFWTKQAVFVLNRLLFFVPKKLNNTLCKHFELGINGLHSLKSPILLLNIVFTSLLQWILMGIAIHLSLMAVNLDATFLASFTVLVFSIFAVMVPAAPGFFGTMQLAFVLALKPFGILESDAIAASILFHFVTYFSVTFLGIFLLHRMGYSVKQFSEESNKIPTD